MTFDDILAEVLDLLQRQGRVSYRALKRRFNLDDEYLEDLKAELIEAQQVAIDEQGRVLVRSERSEPPPAPRGVPEAERRQLTVLFCDLVDSTALAGQLDPEDLREVVRAYQHTCAEVIARFEGYIAQYLGDGLLVYFGYPVAHEDDALRAVQAGLAIIEAIGRLNARLEPVQGVRLALRLGIHTGLVVVGEMGAGGRQESLALGETPNLAARLQGLAAPDTVVISATTFRLMQGLFECLELGPQTLKGITTPLLVYQVVRESGAQSRLEVAGPTGLTPLVGREQEVALLLERWAQVTEGLGMVLESGWLREREGVYELTGPLPALAIPATLHDSLMARLDRLATVKEVAQWGAILGRAFPYDLLQAVAPWDDATLQHALARLVEAELLYQRGLPPTATYLFKHALIQEAAYQSLLKSRRQQAHHRIAQVLEAQFPDTAQTQPELLAHHYTEAGLPTQAIPYWQRAGQRALERSATLEAVAHLTTGLEVLGTLPDTPERAQQELVMHITLGPALMTTKGFIAPEVERVYARARALCQRVGDARQLFRVLWGLYYMHQVRGQLQRAREVGEELLDLARQLQDPVLFVVAHRAQGNASFWRGELGLAHADVQQALALYDPQQMGDHAVRYGQDSGVFCRFLGALTLWMLGYPDQARQWSEEALTQAQGLRHAFTLQQALVFSAILYHLRREAAVAQERAEAQRALCTEQGFADYLAWGTVLWGSALAAQGAWAEGLAQMREGLAAYQPRGRAPRLLFLGLLAEGCGRAGQVEEGLRALHEALEVMQTSEERMYEAEVYRLGGELLLHQSAAQQGEAEASLQQALDVARRQQAKSLELRAAMSLSRLWQRQGKRDEARQLLTEIYDWFTEGFDTGDLQEAKAVLGELA